MSRPKKLTEEEKKLIKREISRRLREAKGTDFTPYTNRDGSESWQQKLEKLICEKDTNEIWAVLANGSGKTAYGAYLICSILHGTHHVKEKVFEGKPLHLHIICEDTDVQRLTIQKYMEEQTDYMLTGYAPVTNKDFFVRRNAGIFKEIVNVKTKDKVTFSTAAEGATGLVGVQPDILFSDEPIAQEVYNELVARNRGANARFIMACTAISSKHGWVIEKARDIRDGRLKAKGVHLLSSRTIDNPHVGLEKVEYWKEIYGEDSHEYRVRALGDLILLEGLVFPGIHNCIVPNDYVPAPYKRVVEMGGTPYRWYEAADFGFSDTDPTLVLYAKQYDNGEVVIEDEICIYNGTTQEWCDAIIKKRHELGMPYRNSINILDPELGIPICKPYKSVGDAKYLQRRSRDTGSSLRSDLVARKIFMSESLKEKVEYRLPAVQNAIRFKTLLFKEKCHESLHFIQMHTYKRKADGTQSPDNSLYDHCADCFTVGHEVLTSKGFVKFDDLTGEEELAAVDLETKEYHFEKPKALIRKEYSGKVYDFGGKMVVTPNHRMANIKQMHLKKTKTNQISITSAEDLAKNYEVYLPITAKFKFKNSYVQPFPELGLADCEWAWLLGMFISEGCTNIGKGGHYRTHWCQKKQPHLEKLTEIFKKIKSNNIPFQTWTGKNGVVTFELQRGRYFDYFSKLGKAKDKYIPEDIFDASEEVLFSLYQGLMDGDGSVTQSHHYDTISSNLAMGFERLCIMLGFSTYSASLPPKSDRHQPSFRITIHAQYKNYPCSHIRNIKEIDYSGEVFCATVSTGAIIVKYGTDMHISGNCLRYLFQTIRGVGKMQEAISETRKENIQKNRRGNKI